MLREIADLIDPFWAGQDPIAVFEDMGKTGAKIALAPLICGCVSYAIPGFRPNLIRFADMPVVGGQPGHSDAWEDAGVNAATSDFYRTTWATLEGAWVRPRHDGYMAFLHAASTRITEGLAAREKAGPAIKDINRFFREGCGAA